MYTTCPECSRQYRIRADQISAAGGLVRCGYCGHQFNTLGRLTDSPLVEMYHQDEPALPDPRSFGPHQAVTETDEKDVRKKITWEPDFYIPEKQKIRELEKEFSEILKGDEQSGKNIFVTLGWTFGVTVMILTGLGQYAWFNREYLLGKYPQWTPLARQLCDRINCELHRNKDVSAIKVLNRDVRIHPVYPDTLLVNATIANRSVASQPFPRIQLALYDTIGEMVAFREFEPAEYLDESIMIEKGMRPDIPVHFVLEVSGHTKEAVGFEFRFL